MAAEFREHNRRAWDRLVRRGDRLTRPAKNADLENPLPRVDPLGWLPADLSGQRLLCLAAGGGKHSAIYASAGARVTVLDLSPGMLELDREVAAARRSPIRVVEGSMDNLSMFQAGEFDIVMHPVSTCYVPDVAQVYREVARVIRQGGLYVSQHKTPQSLQASLKPQAAGYVIEQPYYRTGPLPEAPPSRIREAGTLEFLHRWEQLLGGMCRAGFAIEDLVEPFHADPQADGDDFGRRCQFLAPYVRIKARRLGGPSTSTPGLILP